MIWKEFYEAISNQIQILSHASGPQLVLAGISSRADPHTISSSSPSKFALATLKSLPESTEQIEKSLFH